MWASSDRCGSASRTGRVDNTGPAHGLRWSRCTDASSVNAQLRTHWFGGAVHRSAHTWACRPTGAADGPAHRRSAVRPHPTHADRACSAPRRVHRARRRVNSLGTHWQPRGLIDRRKHDDRDRKPDPSAVDVPRRERPGTRGDQRRPRLTSTSNISTVETEPDLRTQISRPTRTQPATPPGAVASRT
jgi:hypothetical protein